MIKKITLLFLLTFINLYASNEFIQIRGNLFFSCADSLPAFDTSIISAIAQNLKMERINIIHPELKLAFKNKKLKSHIAYAEKKADRKNLRNKLKNLNSICNEGDSISLCCFNLYLQNNYKRVNNNLLNFIISAYEQEINPSIANIESNFLNLPPKDENKVIRYNWLSPAYAMKYLYDGNPFSSLSPALQVSYYFVDALGLACLTGGLIASRSTKDVLLISGLYLTLCAEIRLLSNFKLKREVRMYNIIRNSPYRVPNTVKYRENK